MQENPPDKIERTSADIVAISLAVRNIAWAFFAVILAVGVFFVVWNGRILAHSLEGAADNVKATTGDIQGYVAGERKKLEDPNNQKALATALGVAQDIRDKTLPTLNRTVSQVGSTAQQSSRTIAQIGTNVSDLLAHTDTSVNKSVMPQIAEAVKATTVLVDKTGVSMDEAATAIKEASDKSGRSIDQINAMLASSDPKIQAALDEALATTKDFHSDLHATMDQWPTITADVERTTKNIAKFSKISIIASIVAALAHGFIPGY